MGTRHVSMAGIAALIALAACSGGNRDDELRRECEAVASGGVTVAQARDRLGPVVQTVDCPEGALQLANPLSANDRCEYGGPKKICQVAFDDLVAQGSCGPAGCSFVCVVYAPGDAGSQVIADDAVICASRFFDQQ